MHHISISNMWERPMWFYCPSLHRKSSWIRNLGEVSKCASSHWQNLFSLKIFLAQLCYHFHQVFENRSLKKCVCRIYLTRRWKETFLGGNDIMMSFKNLMNLKYLQNSNIAWIIINHVFFWQTFTDYRALC